MRRFYPYLLSPYNQNYNDTLEKAQFFQKIDKMIVHKEYVRITLLDWQENPLKEIQGELTTGSLTKDGSSAIRRTCSFTANVDANSYTVEDGQMDFAINKKVFIEMGVKNYTDEYTEYPILWFPQGVFFINKFSISSASTSAVTINLSLRDKMSILNGDVGGKIPATTIFDTMDTQAPSGEYITEKVLIYNIIQELVNHFGGEDLNNIIIEDVPLQIKQVMKWMGDTPLYLIDQGESGTVIGKTLLPQLEKPETDEHRYGTYTYGDDIGYIYTDFVYPQDLIASPGDTVASVLETIKNTLGNYEYFYDEFGIFHFREIKNYMNTTQAKVLIDSMNKNDYLVENTVGKATYSFSDDVNLISFNVSPKYENIKNDFIVEGLRKMSGSDISYPVRYHLAIDTKPYPEGKDADGIYYSVSKDFLTYTEEGSEIRVGCFPLMSNDMPPEVGNFNVIYQAPDDFVLLGAKTELDENLSSLAEELAKGEITQPQYEKKVQKLSHDYEEFVKASNVDGNGNCFLWWDGQGYKAVQDPIFYPEYKTRDWRTELYVQGLRAVNNGTDAGYYYPELAGMWTTIYDIDKQHFIGLDSPNGKYYNVSLTDGNYFLDFIDPSTSGLGEFCVSNIGRRTEVMANDDVNCLFQPEIPDVVFVNNDDEDAQEQIKYLTSIGEIPSRTPGNIYNAFFVGGYKNGAFDQIKYLLYLHSSYQKTATMTAIPALYLDPNIRIRINDKTTNTYGDFITQNISITLGNNSSMTVTVSEVSERF